MAEQFRGGVKGIRHRRRIGLDPGRTVLILAEDETTADRVVGAFENALALVVIGGEEHRVGVERQALAPVQDDVGIGVEGDLAAAGQGSRPASRTPATSGSAATGSTVSGCSPVSPSTSAFTLPWPCPVAPSEPNSSTRSPATRGIRPSAASVSVNMPAARIGPTVCELDGPIPILKSSNALIAMARLLSAAPRRCGATFRPAMPWRRPR